MINFADRIVSIMSDTHNKDTFILDGFRSYDEGITKEYFYGYCHRAYAVFDHKYQLRNKTGLDFYSLAHEYYIQLSSHDFRQLEDRPKDMKLSTWMMGGFRFVVLDALKAYNKELENLTTESDVVLEYVRSTDHEEDMLFQIAEAVASHYHDRKMQEIAHMILYAGFKQKEVAKQLGMTPAAINQRYKKMMDEVVTPFVIEHYSAGLHFSAGGSISPEKVCMEMASPCMDFGYSSIHTDTSIQKPLFGKIMHNQRVTPEYITTLADNEIFVFGSNLQGIHAGGAARTARINFGAVMGNGVGMQGQSYAIPTMQGGVETIKPYVDEFIKYAKQHRNLHFLVTPIGCGIAGFEPEDIAPLFESAKDIENIALPESFWAVLSE